MPPELPGTSEMPTALIIFLHGTSTTSIQGSSRCNNAKARKKVLTFIEEQNAAEQASRLEAAKLSSVKNIKCDWLTVGACLFASASNGLICCQVAGCKVLIHHACRAEWESGGPGQETGGCNKFCVGHHPTAKLFAVVERPVARATRASMNVILNEAQPAPTARSTDTLFDASSEEKLSGVKLSVSIASYD